MAHLKFPDLDRNSVRLIGCSDATYANNHDLSSELGQIALHMDDTDRFSPISFKSYISRRVVRSVLAAEVIIFADLFDDAYALRSEFEHALGRSLPVQLITDSNSLFDIISKGSRASEKRIMLERHAARQAYKHKKSQTSVSYAQKIISRTDL